MIDSDRYTPDKEEIEMAISFMRNCSSRDLVETWNKAAVEWEVKSLVVLHKALIKLDRIKDVVSEIEAKN